MEHSPHAMAHSDTLLLEGSTERGAFETVKSILPFLWPENYLEMRVRVVLAVIFLFVGRTASVYGPIVLKDIIDGLGNLTGTGLAELTAPALQPLVLLTLLYGLTVLMPGLMTELRGAIFVPVSEYAQRVFGLITFKHLHDLSMRFHLDRRTGGLSRAIERGTRALQQLVGLFAFNLAPTLFEIAVVSIYLGTFYHFKYVAVILIAVGCYILFTLLFTEWRTQFRRAMVMEESRAMSIGVDSLLNFETVKYFGNERYEADRYNDALVNYMDAAVKSQTTLGMLNGGQVLVRVICQVTILLLAIMDYSAGDLSIGEVVMLNTYMLQLFIPLGFLGSSYRMIRQALVDMEFMFQLLSVDSEVKDKQDASELKVTEGRVDFKGISFGYDPSRRVLNDLTFTIASGKTTAVVGPSGAGKSTISRLLYRFYEVDHGEVSIDGQSIADVTQASLRRAVGIVPQDTVLFNDTIRYNIRYGRPGSTDAEVEEAAKLAAIHDFIVSLPKGYETRVGERGLKLSGGEKQRVAIARTVLKDPPILVLDEATSALDIHTEREIQAAMKEVSRGRTSLIIAHRLSTIIHADEILVLDEGRIIERGTHRQLVEAGGLYATMWQRQKEAADELEKIKQVLDEVEISSLMQPASG